YASIITKIQERTYVELKERRFYATKLGMTVTDLLVEHFPKVMDLKFTSHMEEELDDIETRKYQRNDVLNEFYQPFEQALTAADEPARPVPGLLGLPRVQDDDEPRCGRQRGGDGQADRPRLRQVRQADGAARGAARAVFGLHGVPQVQAGDGRGRQRQPDQADRDGHHLREMRLADGGQARPAWTVPGLRRLPEVPQHQASAGGAEGEAEGPAAA